MVCLHFGVFDNSRVLSRSFTSNLQVTLEEFIDGIMRCKGPARAIDQVRQGMGEQSGSTDKRHMQSTLQ